MGQTRKKALKGAFAIIALKSGVTVESQDDGW
jgi:hypothetical protein